MFSLPGLAEHPLDSINSKNSSRARRDDCGEKYSQWKPILATPARTPRLSLYVCHSSPCSPLPQNTFTFSLCQSNPTKLFLHLNCNYKMSMYENLFKQSRRGWNKNTKPPSLPPLNQFHTKGQLLFTVWYAAPTAPRLFPTAFSWDYVICITQGLAIKLWAGSLLVSSFHVGPSRTFSFISFLFFIEA